MSLSCPKEKFDEVKALGVGYTQDERGGWPTLNEKTQRLETYAWAPRRSRAALTELGCTFAQTRAEEEIEQLLWSSYFHSKASVGE